MLLGADSSTAVALTQPSPFDILPAPPLRARHLRNSRRLHRLSGEAGPWEVEVARQLGAEGFVALDGFLGSEGPTRLRAAVVSALEAAATTGGLSGGGLSGGGAARRLRGNRTLWAASSTPLDLLLSSLDGLVAHALGPRLSGTSDLQWRSDAQFSLYPANGSRYVRHVDNTCSGGKGRLCNGRRLSAVYYLNARWAAADGGELRILRPRAEGGGLHLETPEIDVAPEMDRLLLFWSDSRTPHEVLPSTALRHAVTVWYFSEAELQARRIARGEDGGQLALHRVELRPPLRPGPPGARAGVARYEAAMEGADACPTVGEGTEATISV